MFTEEVSELVSRVSTTESPSVCVPRGGLEKVCYVRATQSDGE